MGATGVTIRKSRIFRTGHRVPTYGHCIDAINAPGLVVEDCICEHAASSGIVLSAGTSAIIRRNFISNVGLIGIAVGMSRVLLFDCINIAHVLKWLRLQVGIRMLINLTKL